MSGNLWDDSLADWDDLFADWDQLVPLLVGAGGCLVSFLPYSGADLDISPRSGATPTLTLRSGVDAAVGGSGCDVSIRRASGALVHT